MPSATERLRYLCRERTSVGALSRRGHSEGGSVFYVASGSTIDMGNSAGAQRRNNAAAIAEISPTGGSPPDTRPIAVYEATLSTALIQNERRVLIVVCLHGERVVVCSKVYRRETTIVAVCLEPGGPPHRYTG